jgi:hypothetical protein
MDSTRVNPPIKPIVVFFLIINSILLENANECNPSTHGVYKRDSQLGNVICS